MDRCYWSGDHADYVAYHDSEWGRPVADDRLLFEKICLEGFQAGLSWLTILRKRPNFREAFDGFDFRTVANYSDRDVGRLLGNRGIVRHRGKIEATINNARRACELVDECGSLASYFWQWEPQAADRPPVIDFATLQTLAKTPASAALSRDLKKRGWRFVGPTTAYAFMQALGMVNDHLDGCFAREIAERRRERFRRPKLRSRR